MTTTPTPQQPNILLICTDQQRFDAVGAYGNPHIRTPNLDRLASQGVLFENCYVQNTVCAPSRASMMTSRYVPNTGLWANGVDLDPSTRLFTRELADAGYDCGLVGKLHLGSCFDGRSEPRVDDGFRVFRWAHDPYPGSSENAYHRWLRAAHPELHAAALQRTAGKLGENGGAAVDWDSMPTEAHYSRWIADETIDFLRTSRQDGPFCFIANFFDPHHGFGAPQEYLDRYDGVDVPGPVTVEGELDGKPPVLTEASERSYAGHAKGYQEYGAEELAQVRRAYYAMVSLVDDEVGRVLDALETEGLAESTVVVFTSDHGELLGDHQLMLKGPMVYDCSVRVPLIVRWPGVLPAGERRDELVQWVDLAPTLLAAAGVAVPVGYQGESLLPLAGGEADAWSRDWALCQYRDSGHAYDPPVHVTMLRHGRHKLVVHHGPPASGRAGAGELYDLDADPSELVNRWDDDPDTRHRLTAMLLDVLVATEDRSNPRLAHW